MAKMAIVTNGTCTGALIDGVYIGKGVGALSLHAAGKDNVTVDLYGLDIKNLEFVTGDDAKERFETLAKAIYGV